MAIMKCKNKIMLKNCSIIIFRDTENGIVKPCHKCSHIIQKYGIKKIICINI
jgi:hypothetical protein|uniref:Uncharacterized protein n=1 Tax=viral metagenome TaxID=1070528 RepID=A0A6C0BFV1_9ZZZZ